MLKAPLPVRLSIVFLNYNRLDETRQTTEQLIQLCKDRSDIEIIAVDNGSEASIGEYLKRQDKIKTVLLSDNRGIAGYNKGFEISKGKYILVLDDDSCPEDLASIDRIIETMESHPDIGLIACHIESPDGRQQWSWHLPRPDKLNHKQLLASPFFIGCGFIIQRELFKRIGWYPGDFFLYQNEIDIAFKIKLQNFKIAYHPQCKIIHRGQPNQRPGWRRVFYPTRNTIWLIRTYYPWPQASYMILSRLLIGLIRAIQFREITSWRKAVREAFSHPVKKQLLSRKIRMESHRFFEQNSLIHQLKHLLVKTAG